MLASVVRVGTVLMRTKVRLPFYFRIGSGSLNRSRCRLRSRNWSRGRNWLLSIGSVSCGCGMKLGQRSALGVGFRVGVRSESELLSRSASLQVAPLQVQIGASVADWGSDSASAPFLGEASASASACESEADRLSDAESDIVFKSESESASGCASSSSAELRL